VLDTLVGARLAGEGVLEIAIASKLAPTVVVQGYWPLSLNSDGRDISSARPVFELA